MGRELRMVPPGWEHPRDVNGNYIPLLSETPGQRREAQRQWEAGLTRDYSKPGRHWKPKDATDNGYTYEEYAGSARDDARMPDFAPGAATHFCMYEDTTEGTPISPAFATPEELARWLADNNASAFGRMGATYEEWLATIKRGWAVGMVIDGGGIKPGTAL